MIGPVVIGFGVGHESKYTAGGVAEAGNVLNGSIGVVGEGLFCGLSIGQGIFERHLLVV